jgi:hypothetical protein
METQEQHSNSRRARLVVVGSKDWPILAPEFLMHPVLGWWQSVESPTLALVTDATPVGNALAAAWDRENHGLELNPGPPAAPTRADARRRAGMLEGAAQLVIFALQYDPLMDRWAYEAQEREVPTIVVRMEHL